MRILGFDAETSPNLVTVWGLWNQNVALNQILKTGKTICWAAKWVGEPEVIFSSSHVDGEEEMLKKAHRLFSEADAVLTYNGRKFDMPTLRREFLRYGMPPPDPYHQIDLLQVAKKEFRFHSNKLDHLAKELGLGQKVKHVGHQLWLDCMNGDDKAWKVMERYNKQDVVLLEKLYRRMLPWIKSHPNHGLFASEDRPVCPNCGSPKVIKKGWETTLTQRYQRYRCGKCSTPIRGRHSVMPAEDRKQVLTQSRI